MLSPVPLMYLLFFQNFSHGRNYDILGCSLWAMYNGGPGTLALPKTKSSVMMLECDMIVIHLSISHNCILTTELQWAWSLSQGTHWMWFPTFTGHIHTDITHILTHTTGYLETSVLLYCDSTRRNPSWTQGKHANSTQRAGGRVYMCLYNTNEAYEQKYKSNKNILYRAF